MLNTLIQLLCTEKLLKNVLKKQSNYSVWGEKSEKNNIHMFYVCSCGINVIALWRTDAICI